MKYIKTLTLVTFFLIGSCDNNTEPDPKTHEPYYEELTQQNEPQLKYTHMFPVPLPDTLTFAGEPVPLDDIDVRERLDRELISNTYRHTNTILVIKRAHRWKPILQGLLKENGIPEDFFYLAVAESDLMNRAHSPAGALGMWQFLSRTAREYGMEVNNYVDERKNPRRATIAAANYFKKAKDKFGSWTMAAGSYNMGMTGIQKRATKQKQDNYYDLFLNTETSRYIFRILAFKLILERPEQYGFKIPSDMLYSEYDQKSITITKTIDNLADFAKEQGTTYKTLRILNPWLNDNTNYKLPVKKGKSYTLFIPAKPS